MNIVHEGVEPVPVTKHETKVGELYTTLRKGNAHFRCQGGFVDMATGAFTGFEAARDDAFWVHAKDAKLIVPA